MVLAFFIACDKYSKRYRGNKNETFNRSGTRENARID